jgi:hypothetical protein
MIYHLKQSNLLKNRAAHVLVTTMFVISVWILLRGFFKYVSLWLIQLGYKPVVIPILIGDPLNHPFAIEMILSFLILIPTWLISTKVKFYQGIKMRFVTFIVIISGILFQYLWAVSIPIVKALIPYLMMKKELIYIENYALEQALFGNMPNLMLLILALPLIFVILMLLWLAKFCNQHWNELIIHFKEWEYALRIPSIFAAFMTDQKKREISTKMKEFFEEKDPNVIPLPDVALGPNVKTGEMVYQKGKDRTLNNLIIGAIGTGKTSALILPIINQDLHHMANMINNFKEYYNNPNYHSEDVKGRLLNGISVIEPSKDLCDKAYALAKAHGIPDEAIFYIDPTNPNTPSINLFQGPTDKVAETFTMVISGIGESQEFFFEQSQRAHLKAHIYLLKEHDPDNEYGFEHLINMYNDPQLVYQMHQKLKARIPDNIDEIEDRDERNKMLILKGISEWFDMTYVPVEKGFGKNAQPEIIKEGPYRGQPRVEDKKAEHVVGLRNILNDIAQNILLRRVLFGKSDFNFDKHLEYGGILLVNTAKGELSTLSDVLGKFVLLSLQNAVFRRKPNDSPYHHIIVDEFPDYINEDFASFPAQSRKYKAIITVVAQTVSQLQRKYGPDFMTTLVATLRNKFVYGDTTKLDAEMFSAIFGEKIVYEESESDQEVSPMMENPSRRTGQSYRKKERARLTASEIIYQDAFVAAVKLVEDNKPIPVQQIRANFVPKEDFKEAKIRVIPEKAEYWLEVRRQQLKDDIRGNQKESTPSFENTEAVLQDEDLQFQLPSTTVNQPLEEVNYDISSSFIIDQSLFANPAPVTVKEPVYKSSEPTVTVEPNQVTQSPNEMGTNPTTSLPKEPDTASDSVQKKNAVSPAEAVFDWLSDAKEEPEETTMAIASEETVSIESKKQPVGEYTVSQYKNMEEVQQEEEETISFNDLFSTGLMKTPIQEEKNTSPKEQPIASEQQQPVKDVVPKMTPFLNSIIKPVGLDDEENDTAPKPDLNTTVTESMDKVFEDELEDYQEKMAEEMKRKQAEKEKKKEEQRKRLEEARKQVEMEKKIREEMNKQQESEKTESLKKPSSQQYEQEVHKEQMISMVDFTDMLELENAETSSIESEMEEQHRRWKQEQIKEKREKRRTTQLGDFGLYHDVLNAIRDNNPKE